MLPRTVDITGSLNPGLILQALSPGITEMSAQVSNAAGSLGDTSIRHTRTQPGNLTGWPMQTQVTEALSDNSWCEGCS